MIPRPGTGRLRGSKIEFGYCANAAPARSGTAICYDHVPTVRTVGYFHTARFPGEDETHFAPHPGSPG